MLNTLKRSGANFKSAFDCFGTLSFKRLKYQVSWVTLHKKMFPADLVVFTEEIVNGKLHFLCSVKRKSSVVDA